MSSSLQEGCSLIIVNDPPYQLVEKLQLDSMQLSLLSQECIQYKLKIWEAKTHKEWLKEKQKQEVNQIVPNSLLQDLREKCEACKGTSIRKLLSDLIKAYEKLNNQSAELKVINLDKEELLQDYQRITNNLSQESNLRDRIKSLQTIAEEKVKTTNELESHLKLLKVQHEELKKNLDNSDTKKFLEEKVRIVQESLRQIEKQKTLGIEISKTNQAIELEKNISTISVETGNKTLKKSILAVEDLISVVYSAVRTKEKLIDKLKLQIEKMEVKIKKNKPETTIMKSYKANSSITSPKNEIFSSKSYLSSPSFKQPSGRNKMISELSKGIDSKNSSKINKVLSSFGDDSQSFTSKIIQLNRGGFGTK